MEKYQETCMYKEILQTKNILGSLYSINEKTLLCIKDEFFKRDIRFVIAAGRGTSENALLFFRYLIEIKLGVSVDIASPSIVTIYNAKVDYRNTLVIAVSQSGEALDALEVVKSANKAGALTVSITNFKDSPLAKETNYHLFLNCEREYSLAATKTFSAQLYVLSSLVYTLSSDEEGIKKLLSIDDSINKEWNAIEDISSSLSDELLNIKDGFIISRGLGLSIADEARVKLSETCYLRMQSFSSASFMHGPLAMVDEGTFVLYIFAKNGPKGSNDSMKYDEFVKNLTKYSELKAKVFVITDALDEPVKDIIYYHLNVSLEEQYLLFLVTLIIQLTAVKTSCKKGINPDKPRSLNKVTFTK